MLSNFNSTSEASLDFPECAQSFTYEQGSLMVCPMCGHEWSAEAELDSTAVIRDTVRNVLKDGDTLTIAKDLKVKGAGGGVLEVGIKVRGSRLIEDGVGDHDIDATVPGRPRLPASSAWRAGTASCETATLQSSSITSSVNDVVRYTLVS